MMTAGCLLKRRVDDLALYDGSFDNLHNDAAHQGGNIINPHQDKQRYIV